MTLERAGTDLSAAGGLPAREAGPDRVSLRDVAVRAGVSVASASNVLNRRRPQDDAIGRAVRVAASDLGYRANAMAANLRRARTRLVGVLLPDFENPYFGALLAALERAAEDSGYRLTAASSREDPAVERREIGALLDWRVAGIIVAPTLDGLPASLAGAGVPAVVIDRVTAADRFDEVASDGTGAARRVTERLLALGHRHILAATSDPLVLNMAERVRGIEAALAEQGGRARLDVMSCGWTVESADRAFAAHLAARPLPTAIFALHNLATLAAYGALARQGLVPGRDVALVGFDDAAWMAHVHPTVAAVGQPIDAIARRAWARLMARIDGDGGPARRDRVPCDLHERETMVPPPARRTAERPALGEAGHPRGPEATEPTAPRQAVTMGGGR